MTTIDTFDPATREIVTAEIAKHREEAYEQGLSDGRKQASTVAIAAWLRGAVKSTTMQVGVLGIGAGLLAEAWPVAAELLAGRIDPQVLALIGAVIVALRAKTGKPLSER